MPAQDTPLCPTFDHDKRPNVSDPDLVYDGDLEHASSSPLIFASTLDDDYDYQNDYDTSHESGGLAISGGDTKEPADSRHSSLYCADGEDHGDRCGSDSGSGLSTDDDAEASPIIFATGEGDEIAVFSFGMGRGRPLAHRRGSVPLGQLNTWDDQLTSIKLPRRSRSLDDERSLPRFDADLATTLASKGKHSKIHAGIPEQLAQESPTAEFDLSYIYNLPTGPVVMPKTVADGSAPFDPISSKRSSVALSFVQIPPHGHLPSGSRLTRHGSGASSRGNGERLSITTSWSGEDAFEKCLRKMDHDFADTKEMWTFRKERSASVEASADPVESTGAREPVEGLRTAEAESPATSGMIPGSREIWRCIRVGRLEITRHKLVHNKPNNHCLEIRHIPDPSNLSNTRGGPRLIVHKHSQVATFTLFRDYNLHLSSHEHPHDPLLDYVVWHERRVPMSAFLAPKVVQMHHSNARQASKRRTFEPSAHVGTGRTLETISAPLVGQQGNEAWEARSMTERTTRSLEKRRDRQVRPMDWAIASGLGKTLRNNLTGNSGEPAECRPTPVTRAEDLDSLDSILGPARGGTVSESRPTEAAFSSSIFSKVRKRWGQSISPTSPPPAASAGSTSLEYLQSARSSTLLSHHDKDARSTAIKDTGPLSLARSLNSGRRTRASSGSMGDIFRHVPNESLCMLLPLWPGETDLASALRERAKYEVSLRDRSYLLVYYVPFDKQKSAGDPETKVDPLVERPSHAVTGEISAHWTSFAVCASLLSHDIYGSRAGLPDKGLAITGPVSEAINYLPSKEGQKISTDVVIAVCYRREMGIELNLEGLATLGLCMPMTDPFSDPSAISLTPIGRAVAEIIWLGAMALTSM